VWHQSDHLPVLMNEDAVGRTINRAIKDGIVTREELFVVSKLCVQGSL